MVQKIAVTFFCLLSLIFTGCAATNKLATQNSSIERAVIIDLGNGTFKDERTGLMWQKERSQLFSTVEEAENYVKNLKLAGHDDWRLPTVFELYELHFTFDFKKTENLVIKKEGSYWSMSDEEGGRVGAWETGQQCEVERNYFTRSKGYVRAVRRS